MAGLKKIVVYCKLGGKLIAPLEYPLPEGMVPSPPPERQALIDMAKTGLTNLGLAFPPYDGITFEIRYP